MARFIIIALTIVLFLTRKVLELIYGCKFELESCCGFMAIVEILIIVLVLSLI